MSWLRPCRRSASVLLLLAVLDTGMALAQARYEIDTDPPIQRSFYWFRYVAGRDIRNDCTAASPLRLRFVYNAIFNDQVRTYDIERQADGSARFHARVFADMGAVGTISLSRLEDIAGPWNPRRSTVKLAAADLQGLLGRLAESAGFGPPPRGLELPSNDYWWSVASCRDGQWGFQAYHFPTDGFARIRFKETLYRFDGTAVVPIEPRKLPPAEFRGERTRNWRLAVGQDGLRDY